MKPRSHRPAPGAIACLLCLVALGVQASSCCPDNKTETCYTLDQWSHSPRCKDFPKPATGEQCPTAAAVAKSCDSDEGPMRVDGDRCCYRMPAACM